MITNINLTDSGIGKFNRWFADVAKPGVRIDAVMLEMLDKLQDLVSTEQSAVYELGRQYTASGVPQLIKFDLADDIEITMEADE